MQILNMCLVNVIRRSFSQLATQSRTKRGVFLIMPSKLNTCRTFFLATWLNKKCSPDATEKLDLDGWKHVMRTPLQDQTSEKTSETEEDSNVVATKELIEVMRLINKLVPENISEEQFKTLLECPSKTSKKKYLAFLAKKEILKKAKKEKKKELKETLEIERNSSTEPENKLFLKLWSSSEDTAYNWRVAQSMMFGQPLVFDMDFENDMSDIELNNAVKQMMECEGYNRRAKDPFHFHYCNFKTNGRNHKEFRKRYGEIWDKLMVTVTEKTYLEMFPRDQLVYLTGDSPNVMKKFEHDKIYIVGCLVDKSPKPGFTFARAKRLKLATARLPLDRYLDWQIGSKNLTLNQVINILLSLKDTGSWEEALEFVPKRKHSGFMDPSIAETVISKKQKPYGGTASSSKWQSKGRWWEDGSS